MVSPINSSGALSLQHSLGRNINSFNQAAERLSTGLKLNAGKDGPAALISSEQLRSALATLEAETQVLQRQDHIASTADAALSEVSAVLADTRGLQVQAADSTRSDSERAAIQMQIDSSVQAVDRMARAAGFNGTSLFSGDFAMSTGGQTLSLPRVDSASLGQTEMGSVAYTLADVASGGAFASDPASGAMIVDAAIDQVATLRGRIGAYQANAVGAGLDAKRAEIESTTAAASLIRDTDFAAEVVEMSRAAMLTQMNMQVLSSVNSAGARVLDLLG